MNPTNKRDRLINAAAALFHRKGIMATSLADIAKDADIPIGNVYYYFKTKEELALSALTRHKEQYIALFDSLIESLDDPRERLKQSLEYYTEMTEEFSRYGCPVGKFVMDVDMDGVAIDKAAAEVFECYIIWAEAQFRELGQEEKARIYAASVLAGIQGAILLAKALKQPDILTQEIARLTLFIDQIPNKRIPIGKGGLKLGAA